MMRRLMTFLVLVLIGSVSAGCSVYMAATQPGQKDLSLLSKGQPRAKLIAEYGKPVHTEIAGGVRKDIFAFTQGYHTGAKVGRAVLHGAADVFTLGLWEAVGTPAEGYFNGTKLSAEVIYDHNDRVAEVRPLKGGNEIRDAVKPARPPKPSA